MNTLKSVKLGNRELGEVIINVESVAFEETPQQDNRYEDRATTKAGVYLKLDLTSLRDLDGFYSQVVAGDIAEGVSSEKPYYELLGIYLRDDISTELVDIIEVQEQGWDLYHTNEKWLECKYLVKVY